MDPLTADPKLHPEPAPRFLPMGERADCPASDPDPRHGFLCTLDRGHPGPVHAAHTSRLRPPVHTWPTEPNAEPSVAAARVLPMRRVHPEGGSPDHPDCPPGLCSRPRVGRA